MKDWKEVLKESKAQFTKLMNDILGQDLEYSFDVSHRKPNGVEFQSIAPIVNAFGIFNFIIDEVWVTGYGTYHEDQGIVSLWCIKLRYTHHGGGSNGYDIYVKDNQLSLTLDVSTGVWSVDQSPT